MLTVHAFLSVLALSQALQALTGDTLNAQQDTTKNCTHIIGNAPWSVKHPN